MPWIMGIMTDLDVDVLFSCACYSYGGLQSSYWSSGCQICFLYVGMPQRRIIQAERSIKDSDLASEFRVS